MVAPFWRGIQQPESRTVTGPRPLYALRRRVVRDELCHTDARRRKRRVDLNPWDKPDPISFPGELGEVMETRRRGQRGNREYSWIRRIDFGVIRATGVIYKLTDDGYLLTSRDRDENRIAELAASVGMRCD